MELNFSSSSLVEAKRADKIKEFEAKRNERLAARDTRRAAAAAFAGAGTTREPQTPEEFWAAFNAELKVLKAAVAALDADEVASYDADKVKEASESWDKASTDLQVLINDCTRFLPPFDTKKAQSLLDGTGADIAAVRAKAAPRQKFSFSRKVTTTGASIVAKAAAAAAKEATPVGAAPSSASTASKDPSTSSNNPFASSSSSSSGGSSSNSKPKWEEDQHTIEGLKGRCVYMPLGAFTSVSSAASTSSGGDGGGDAPVVQTCPLTDTAAVEALFASSSSPSTSVALNIKGAKDLRLLDLTDCVVVLSDVTRAIRIDGLKRCVVIAAGPTAGSVLLHNCQDSVFMLTSRQIRLHTSTNCAFLLTVQSRPIIEYCTGFWFGPNPLHYPLLPHCLAVAGGLPDIHAAEPKYVLAAAQPSAPSSTTSNVGEASNPAAFVPGSVHLQWRSVDDFGWHRVQRSPNWDVMPLTAWPATLGQLASLLQLLATIKGASKTGTTAADAAGEGDAAALDAKETALGVIESKLGLRCSTEGAGFEAVVRSVRYLEEEEQERQQRQKRQQLQGQAEAQPAAAASVESPAQPSAEATEVIALTTAAAAPSSVSSSGIAVPPPTTAAATVTAPTPAATIAPSSTPKVVIVAPAAPASNGAASAASSAPAAAVEVKVASTLSKVVLPATVAASAAGGDDDDDEL